MKRGDIWWANLPTPRGSEPGGRRPVVIVQADSFNRTRLKTVIAAIVTSNLKLAAAPGNVLLTATESGLPQDSVVNVSQIVTIDKTVLTDWVSELPPEVFTQIEEGMRLILEL
ncbi:MAG TPA: type II toxin-antitoxin system PemK/MazF family toxin [Blastocatellia bacterium]|nr:type II toxin-antitoxin system PemK/MazF family toxin [Blastocatellia bacterium]